MNPGFQKHTNEGKAKAMDSSCAAHFWRPVGTLSVPRKLEGVPGGFEVPANENQVTGVPTWVPKLRLTRVPPSLAA